MRHYAYKGVVYNTDGEVLLVVSPVSKELKKFARSYAKVMADELNDCDTGIESELVGTTW